ncbi:MAG TPA: HAD-IIIA family hydrolase [Candidatus Acidoferrum sp.]|nr:HAD-IIIA family hydrolase [Candidatus Acidoferrum sp.]
MPGFVSSVPMSGRFLVIRLGSLGDVILTSATVLNLRINYPDSEIVFLTRSRFRIIAEAILGVDRVIALADEIGVSEYYRALVDMDREGFTTIIDLHGNLRSWLARRVLSGTLKLVYPKRRLERQRIVRTHTYPESWPHTIDLYNSVLTQLKMPVYVNRPVLNIGSNGPRQNSVVMAPGAAHANKQWPIERFADVAVALNQSAGVKIIWAVTSGDRGRVKLEDKLERDQYEELVDVPIERLGKVIADARLVIANDSGVMHLASAVGTPVVAIFGPTHQSLGFSPRGLFDRVVEVDEFCRPCSLHGKKPCYREERYCFTRISPEMVSQVAGEMLSSPVNTAPALFVDRDGTVMEDKHYLSDPDQVELLPGAVEALKATAAAGFRMVVISNQSGIARGMFTKVEAEKVNARLVEMLRRQGVEVAAIYFCPHYPGGSIKEYAISCECRKPAPGMAERAARELGVDFRRSIVVGDKVEDLALADAIGARSVLVLTGHGRESEERLRSSSYYRQRRSFEDLPGAVRFLISGE